MAAKWFSSLDTNSTFTSTIIFSDKDYALIFYLLQDNFDNLGEECLDSVKTYTQMEAKNAVLNPVIATACHGYIDRYCSDEVLHKVSKQLWFQFWILDFKDTGK